ncbi:MAG: phage head morphogenesis protein, partial [Alkalibacterium sp.]|nr:phage head morphogenesis protein [Alkalibacterium sp.]
MSDYWAKRNEELERIRQQFNTDAQYNKELERIYTRAQREIDKEIQAELTSFATRDEVSMAEARRRVDKMDVEAFKEKAKRYVEEKNFSPRANEELRAYNTRMRMSRLELLKHNIHLETVALADEEDKLLSARLTDEAVEEYRRQAGILGETIPDNLDRVARQLVAADYKGTDFSERIWRDQKKLRNGLEGVLDDVLVRGQHPTKASKALRELVTEEFLGKDGKGGAAFVAKRLAVTESAHIQTEVQKASYKEYGITQMEWVAEPDACPDCA